MKIEKGKNLVANLHDKTEYHIDTKFKTVNKSQIEFEKGLQSD